MQGVSGEWKANQRRTLVNESFVEVSLDIADPDALADASAHDNGATHISNTASVVSEVDRNIVPYSTLEQNLWILDGSRKTLPTENVGECGFVGDVLSDEKRGFSNKTPVVTVRFTRLHRNPVPAVTITWGKVYNEFAEDFIVTVYNGDAVVAQKEVIGNKDVRSVVMMDIVDYDRITISILRWCLPYHRVRIEEIFVGLNKVYGKSALFSYAHSQTVDAISTSLPKAEVSFSVDNMDNTYNPYNAEGLSKYLMERQEIKTRYGSKMDDGSVEWIKGGTYYLSEWRATQNGISADFTARDLLEFLFVDYVESVTEITPRSLYDIAKAVFESADLPLNNDGSKKWYIDDSLRGIYTSAPLPVDTKANCLLMVANAAGCVLYQDRNGIVRIEPRNSTVSDYSITLSNSYKKPEIVLTKTIKEVVVRVYEYSIVDGKIESVETDVVINVGSSGEQIKVDNPLITDVERATAVGKWVANYLTNRVTLEVEWRPDVRLDALDMVQIANQYGNNNALMTEVKFDFSGAFRGKGKGRVM